MNKEWFTAQELAGLPAMPKSESAVIRRAKREGWRSQSRGGRGGAREYHLSALPDETKAVLLKQQVESGLPDLGALPQKGGRSKERRTTPDAEALWAAFDRKPDSEKEAARSRLAIVRVYFGLVGSGMSKTQAADHVQNTYEKPSRATLYRWLDAIKELDEANWLPALAPDHSAHRGKRRTQCSDEAWDYFKTLYLRLEAPSVTTCWNWTHRAAEKNGWDWPPLRTIQRWVDEHIDHATKVLMREGEHALMRLFPPQKRSVRGLRAMEWINGDGYQHNIFVRFEDGTIGRPKTWFWQDVRTRKIVGYRADRTEHSDMIRLALGDVIDRYGIPEHATIDNTRAAANKWMTGGVKNRYRFKVKEEDPLGLMPQLGIQVHWTTVHNGKGHGQAKPVERAFGVGGLGEYVDKRWEFRGAYTGPNVTAKPENYGDKAVDWKVFEAVLEDAIQEWNARQGRDTEICGGVLSFDAAFEESYDRAQVRQPTAVQKRLWLLTAESVLVRQGTVALSAGKGRHGKNRYSADCLIPLEGKRIVVRFDPQNLHKQVYAYHPNGIYIGPVECNHAVGFGDSEAAREWNRQNKQRLKREKEAAKAERRMSELEMEEMQPALREPTEPEKAPSSVIRGAFEQPRRAVGSDVVPSDDDQSPADKHDFDGRMMQLSAAWVRNHPDAPRQEDD